jgi:hypothetical protein
VPRKPIPQTQYECADQFVRGVERAEIRQLSTPQGLYGFDRRSRHNRRRDIAEESRAHVMKQDRAAIAFE